MENQMREVVEKAKHQSKVGGAIKFMYYISVFGYLFSYEKHKLSKDIVLEVWNRS